MKGAVWVRLPALGWVHVRPGVHQCLNDEIRTGAVQKQLRQKLTHTHAHLCTRTHKHMLELLVLQSELLQLSLDVALSRCH